MELDREIPSNPTLTVCGGPASQLTRAHAHKLLEATGRITIICTLMENALQELKVWCHVQLN